jgi:hypothetical protein
LPESFISYGTPDVAEEMALTRKIPVFDPV